MSQVFNQNRERIMAMCREKHALIAAHRGVCGGNIVQNTIPAFQNALRHRADIVEVDVAMTTDGVFYAFHDGQEPNMLGCLRNIRTMRSEEVDSMYARVACFDQTLEHVNRLEDVMAWLRGKNCLVNLDRSWFYWPALIRLVRGLGMEDQVILKSPPEPEYLAQMAAEGGDLMYMPIINRVEELERVSEYDLNWLAAELMFHAEDDPLVEDARLAALHERGILLWANVLSLNYWTDMCAHHDDYHAITEGPEESWGWCVHKGFDILQTDWPMLLRSYLDTL